MDGWRLGARSNKNKLFARFKNVPVNDPWQYIESIDRLDLICKVLLNCWVPRYKNGASHSLSPPLYIMHREEIDIPLPGGWLCGVVPAIDRAFLLLCK